MKYILCVLGTMATTILIYALWTNSVNVVYRSAITGLLILSLLELIRKTLEGKRER